MYIYIILYTCIYISLSVYQSIKLHDYRFTIYDFRQTRSHITKAAQERCGPLVALQEVAWRNQCVNGLVSWEIDEDFPVNQTIDNELWLGAQPWSSLAVYLCLER